jgi:chromosome segregation ATPase
MDDRTVGQAVGPTLRTLDSFLSVVDTAKETSVPMKGSVWDVAEERVPGLGDIESRARDLRTELREWEEESKNLDRRLCELENETQAEDVDYEAVSRLFSDALDSMERLDRQSERLERRLNEASEKSSEVATKSVEIPVLGDRVRERLEELSSGLSDTADEVRDLNRNPGDVIEVHTRAER